MSDGAPLLTVYDASIAFQGSIIGSEGWFNGFGGVDDAADCRMVQVGFYRDSAVGPPVLKFAAQHVDNLRLRSFGELPVRSGKG